MGADVVEKYLRVHAEPEIALLRQWSRQCFQQCLVIPAYRETTGFVQRLIDSPFWKNADILVIIVINQPVDTPVDPLNQKLAEFFQPCPLLETAGNLRLYRVYGQRLLVVDRFTTGRQIPVRHGVGAARKIGFDLAVYLHVTGQLQNPVIYSADADAILPNHYFSTQFRCSSAAVFDFEHIAAAGTDAAVFYATGLYESALRYFRQGLQWAGSPYAFTSMGSAMAVHARAYCQVHGFPRRSGGEDFYLLNKLAKIAPVQYVPQIRIRIVARRSSRVPFGTGPAIQQILALDQPDRDYLYYHPDLFVLLKNWIDLMPELCRTATNDTLKHALPATALDALQSLGVDNLVSHLATNTPHESQRLQSTHQWFDAFRTLKFIRYLQTRYVPPLPLAMCLQQAPWR